MTNEDERARNTIKRLEQQIFELREELARVQENKAESGDVEKVDLEVQLQHVTLRAEALQSQLDEQTLSHAREMQIMKQQLLQKESLIDTMQRGQYTSQPKFY